MRYLILDKKQRIHIENKLSFVLTRFTEELEAMKVDYTVAYNDEIEVSFIDGTTSITVQGEDIRNFTHIYFRGMRLDKPLEYETRKIIVDYIEQYNLDNPKSIIQIQNKESIKTIEFYDKIFITHILAKNNIGITDTLYRANGQYPVKPNIFGYPVIVKQYAGENDIREIDGKNTVKKNVYLVNSQEEYQQEFLKDKKLEEYITQEFLPSGEDFRVFVSKGVAFAGFSRKATKNFMTVSSGEYTKIDLNERLDLKEFSEKVAKVLKADFIAVDSMMKGDNPVLQEISLNPGFKAFETKTGGEDINMAKAILEAI
jgi:glutathione synthase/RimK-type ligase-like ATP-grasp enzyme